MKAKGSVLKYGDNVDTDVIIPARYLNSYDAKELASHAMVDIDPTFVERLNPWDIVVGGKNFGCGSSREHAALAPLYLGVKAVIVKSFARIHMANLINAGIVPLTFANESDYDKIDQMDELKIENIGKQIANGKVIKVTNVTKGFDFEVNADLSDRQKEMLYAGGLLNYTKQNS